MKIIDTNFNEQLRGKVISVGDKDNYMMEEAAIEFTGRTRKIKTIFGRIKEQAEIYVITKHWDMWHHNTYRLIKNGPYWDSKLI